MQQRIEQLSTAALRRPEVLFQAVAQCHQYVDLGDDSVLFGEGREGDRNLIQAVFGQPATSGPCLLVKNETLKVRR